MQNNLNEQMDNLFGVDDYSPKFNKPTNVQTLDESIPQLKDVGTGILRTPVGTFGDIVSGVTAVNSFLADNAYNPMAMLIRDKLVEGEKTLGSDGIREWFAETTGLEYKKDNIFQNVGELIGLPALFITKPAEVASKVINYSKPTFSKFSDELQQGIKNTLTDDLAFETAKVDNLASAPIQKIDDINRPKIDLSTVAPDLTSSKKYIEAESSAIQSTEKFSKTQKIGKDGALYDDLSFEQKQKLYDDTGIYRGEDGKLRTNISMKDVSLKNEAFEHAVDLRKIKLTKETKLKNIINYADLFKMFDKKIVINKTNAGVYRDYLPSTYGPIGDIRIKIIKDTASPLREIGKGGAFASYDPISDVINVPQRATPEEMLSSIVHEVQHAIQYRQGFQGGDNVLRHLPKQYLEKYKDVQNQIKISEENNFLTNNFNRSEGKVINQNMEWLKPSVDANFEDAMTVFWKANNDPKYYADKVEYESGLKEYLATQREEFADDMRNALIQLAKREVPSFNKYNKINLEVKKGDTSLDYLDDGTVVKEYEFTDGDIALINYLREGGGKSRGNIMYTNDLAKQERIDYGADRAPTPASLNSVISTRKMNFENHIKNLARLRKQQIKLDNIYEIAEKRYFNSFGEKEARYAEKRLNSPDLRPADDMFFKLRRNRQGRESVDVVASGD